MAATLAAPRSSSAGGPGALPADVESAVRVQHAVGVSLHLTHHLVQHQHALLEAKDALEASGADRKPREVQTPDEAVRFRGNNDVITTLTKVAESLNQAQAELEYRKRHHGILAHQQLGAVYDEITHGFMPEEVSEQVVRDMEAMSRIHAEALSSSRPPSRIAPMAVPAVLANIKEKDRWGYFKSAPWLMPDQGGVVLRKRTSRPQGPEQESKGKASGLANIVTQAMLSNAPMVMQVRERSSRVKEARESWEHCLKLYKQRKRENYMTHLSNILASNMDHVRQKFAARIIQRAWRRHLQDHPRPQVSMSRSVSRKMSTRRQQSMRRKMSRHASGRRNASMRHQASMAHGIGHDAMAEENEGQEATAAEDGEAPLTATTHFPTLVALLNETAASTAAGLTRSPTKDPKKSVDYDLWDSCTTKTSPSMKQRSMSRAASRAASMRSIGTTSYRERCIGTASMRERSGAALARSTSNLGRVPPSMGPSSTDPFFVISRVVRSAGGVGIATTAGDLPLATRTGRARPSRSADGARPAALGAAGAQQPGIAARRKAGKTVSFGGAAAAAAAAAARAVEGASSSTTWNPAEHAMFKAQVAGGICWPRTEREAQLRTEAAEGCLWPSAERRARLWGAGATASQGPDLATSAQKAAGSWGGSATGLSSALNWTAVDRQGLLHTPQGVGGPSQGTGCTPGQKQPLLSTTGRRMHAVSDFGAPSASMDTDMSGGLQPMLRPQPPGGPPGRQVTFRTRVSTSGVSCLGASGGDWSPGPDKEGEAFPFATDRHHGRSDGDLGPLLRAHASGLQQWPEPDHQAPIWGQAAADPQWQPDTLFPDDALPHDAHQRFVASLHEQHGVDALSETGRLRQLLRQDMMTSDPHDTTLTELRERYCHLQREQRHQYMLLRQMDLLTDLEDGRQKLLREQYAELQDTLQGLAAQIQSVLQARRQQRQEQTEAAFAFSTFPRGAGGGRGGSLMTLERLRTMRGGGQSMSIEELRAALMKDGLQAVQLKVQGVLKRGPARSHLGHIIGDERGTYDPEKGWGDASPMRIAGITGRPRCSMAGSVDSEMSHAASVVADAASAVEEALAWKRQQLLMRDQQTGRSTTNVGPQKHPRMYMRSLTMNMSSVPSIRRSSEVDSEGLLPMVTGIKNAAMIPEGEERAEGGPQEDDADMEHTRRQSRAKLPTLSRQPSRLYHGSLSKAYRETQRLRWTSHDGSAVAVRAAAEAEMTADSNRSPKVPRPRPVRSPPVAPPVLKAPSPRARMAFSWSGTKQPEVDEGLALSQLQ